MKRRRIDRSPIKNALQPQDAREGLSCAYLGQAAALGSRS